MLSMEDEVVRGRLSLALQNCLAYSTISTSSIRQRQKVTLEIRGVSGAVGVELVSVMEGDSITLNPGVTDIQKNKLLFKFGAEGALIALKDGKHITVFDDSNERFKGRLHLDRTGALTISDSKTTDSGLYDLNIKGGREDQVKKFNVTVYPRLPSPVIIRKSTQNSSSSVSEHSKVSRCVLLCSVVNVSAVSLSWYKGNSVLSSISVSDLSRSLSLPLELEYQDKNTYSCVINNTGINLTTHLNITHLCQPVEESPCCGSAEGVMRLVIAALVGVAAAAFVVEDIRSRKAEQESREQIRC